MKNRSFYKFTLGYIVLVCNGSGEAVREMKAKNASACITNEVQ